MKKQAKQLFLSLDDHCLKIMIIGKESIPEVIQCFDLPKDSIHAIEGFLQEHIIKKYSQALSKASLLVPRKWITVKQLSLPSTDRQEIERMIPFQAVKLVPYAIDEIVIDYNLLSTDEKGLSTIKLFVMPIKIVAPYIDLIQKTGLIIEQVSPAQELSMKYFKHKKIVSNKTEFIMDFDRYTTTIYAVKKGVFKSSRTLSKGDYHIKKDPDSLSTAIRESVDFLKRDYALQKVDSCTILGAQKNKDVLETMISPLLNCKLHSIDVTKSLTISKLQETVPYFSCTALLGAAASGKELGSNLLPETYKNFVLLSNKKKNLRKTVILSLTVVFLIGLLITNEYFHNVQAINKTQKEISLLQNRVKKLESMRKQLKLVTEYQSNKNIILAFLSELSQLIPENVFLKDLSYKSEGKLIIKGTASDPSEVFDLVPKMEESELFKSVSTRYVRKTRHRGRDYTDFFIECDLEK